MGILALFKKSNILENNLVQTAASAGESLAAGVIFTIPALILMGYWQSFDYLEVAKISAIGGIIGVMFTVPLRRAFILVAKLQYPEGIATAEVLKAGEKARAISDNKSSSGLKMILMSSLAGGLMKLSELGFSMWNVVLEKAINFGNVIFGLGTNLSPALLSVGFIVGRNIGILVVCGGLISWGIAIPIYSGLYGFEGDPLNAAYSIWNSKIRYLGVGAMVVGGIWSLIKLFNPLIIGIKDSLQAIKGLNTSTPKEEQDIPINFVGIVLLIMLIPVFLLYLNIIQSTGIAILLTFILIIFGFLFSAVAAYMAGVVGSSNNPISGVTIATILFSSLLLFFLLGADSNSGSAGAIMIGAIVCCAAAIGGDNLQDLKTGYIVGATPWKQQIMQIIGVLSASVVLGVVLDILHTAYTIGSPSLSAPQATLMKSVADGVFKGNLPWDFVYFGAAIAVIIILLDIRQEKRGSEFRIPVLAVAVGIYLPIELTVPIFIGGMINHLAKNTGTSTSSEENGLLLASGLITGETLMAIFIALPIFLTGNKDWWPTFPGYDILGILSFIAIIFWIYNTAIKK
ncbi:MAG: oligopeptide transporter, OPT family [Candidatus Marinimicrobia bacterium]|nr:oligopeptide transporter, OPT family [Candidatus Neomarinimicrobiota bacterium]